MHLLQPVHYPVGCGASIALIEVLRSEPVVEHTVLQHVLDLALDTAKTHDKPAHLPRTMAGFLQRGVRVLIRI